MLNTLRIAADLPKGTTDLPKGAGDRARHVLVIDADPLVQRAVATALALGEREMHPFDVRDASALVNRPGAIAYDYDLPWTSVRSLAEQVRALLGPLSVVVLLGSASAFAARCAKEGVPVFAVKPAPKRALLEVGAVPRRARILVVDISSGEHGDHEKVASKPATGVSHRRIRVVR